MGYEEGNPLLPETAFSENSLINQESILWTKGEILGKGAYGTVSYIESDCILCTVF